MPKYSVEDIAAQARKTFKTVEIGVSHGLEDWYLYKVKGKWYLRRMGVLEFAGESTDEVIKDICLYRGDHLVIQGGQNETSDR